VNIILPRAGRLRKHPRDDGGSGGGCRPATRGAGEVDSVASLGVGDFRWEPRGPFTLASAARFIGGWPPTGQSAAPPDQGTVRLCFLVDDWTGHAGVVLEQDAEGVVHGTIRNSTAADAVRIRDQAARIVSLDHDGTGYAAVGERDSVVGELQRASGWLRPVLFHSPFEAACWAVISARQRQSVAAITRDRLSRAHGAVLDVAGQEMFGFPTPERLLPLTAVEGLSSEKLRRLHGIAGAALEGRLDRQRLLGLDHDAALAELVELPGIGRFWSQGILLRAVGPTDAVTLDEPRVRQRAAERYANAALIDDDPAFLGLAERWRPYRTWVQVLLRAAP
jgi:DNA-3-methyladenine glycosylase II